MNAQEQRLRRVVDGWQARGKWPHALMISGSDSIQMLALAKALAKRRLCASASACGQCDACRWFDGGNHLDFHTIASAPTAEELGLVIEGDPGTVRRLIRKEQVAEVLRHLGLRSRVEGGWRVLLLVHPEELHPAAANALLKTLEEPGERVFFVLISGRPRAVLDTIVSRCQQLALPPPSRQELTRVLEEQGEEKASVHAELMRRGLQPGELEGPRGEALEWLSAIAAGEDHRRLMALDRMNTFPDQDRMIGLALSLTLDLLRLQSGMAVSALTHNDLGKELGQLAPAGPWLSVAKTLAEARPKLRRNVRLQSLLMGAMR